MNKLNGNLTRDKDSNIVIKLNMVCEDGVLYYRNKINGEKKYLLHINKLDEIKFKDPNPNNRTFYEIESKNNKLFLAERLLPLNKYHNFRDLGGYETKDGRKVKWGLFYRSENLSKLKGKDLELFKSLNIKYVLDYRSNAEAKKKPDVEVENVRNIRISAMGGLDDNNFNTKYYAKKMIFNKPMSKTPEEVLLEGYENMPINNKAYKKLMELFKNPDNTGILQHCSEGKDRTGFGSALILLALGVDEKTVIKDYLKSNYYMEKHNRLIEEVTDKIINENMERLLEQILGVNKKYIGLSLRVIKEKYSSYEDYFKKEYDLDKDKLNKLRDIYLY
ncbi:MAG: tyrosine-protein phosphatase [Clostridium sp.]|uniref:tyrosine-protein phosphatase n=1 Tax=Clostridium sp. TaxID=1506 RepID=UPI003F3EF170